MINIFDIREKSGKIYLIGRDDKDDSRVIVKDENNYAPFHGEFYIRKDSIDTLDEFEGIIEVILSLTDKKSIFGDELMTVKYQIVNFDRVRELRDLIEEYKDVLFEADLWGRTKYCLDTLPGKGYGKAGNWKKCYMDIETGTEFGFPDSNNPKEKVLCSTFYDSYTKKYHFFYFGGERLEDRDDIIMYQFNTEKSMLVAIVEWMKDMEFDMVTGWNIHFDVSYLLQRYLYLTNDTFGVCKLSPIGYYSYNEKYKQFSIWGLCIFDLLEGYKRIVRNQLASFKLDNVAEEELGEKKVEVDIKTLNIIPKEKLLEYNKKDVELCVRIDEKVNVFNFFDGLRQFVGCPMDDTKYSRSLIDFMILKKARKMNIALPTASNNMAGRKKYEGAFVDAVQGNYDNVVAFDIAGLYPNIIKTFNLSPECCMEEGGVKLPELNIDMSKEGIIPSIVNDLMVLRKKYDDERDKYPAGHELHEKNDILVESAKLIVDAIYGMCAFPGFRLFKSEIASSITYVGREIIQHTKEFIEGMGPHKVVVTDTDSSYFTSSKEKPEEVIQEGYDILKLVNTEYIKWVKDRWGIDSKDCYLVNVFKKVYDRLIVGTKKRYCGHVVWAKGIKSDKTEVVGMETKRSDYSRFARDFQFQLMKLLLNNEEDEVISNFIKEKMTVMKKTSLSLIGIPTKIERYVDDYVTNLPKVRGSKYSSKFLGQIFGKGDKPLLLFCKGESDVILYYDDKQANKLLERVQVDWDKMTERNILMTSNMLLESCGKNHIIEMIKLLKNNQSTLTNF